VQQRARTVEHVLGGGNAVGLIRLTAPGVEGPNWVEKWLSFIAKFWA
jgi:hypothetical protein